MDKHKKNYIVTFIIGIIILFVLSVFFVTLLKKIIIGSIKEDDVYINSSDYTITIKDKLSVSDEFGKSITEDNDHSFGYIEFEVLNNVEHSRNFEIYITEKENEDEINPSYIKFYLTDEEGSPYPLFEQNKIPTYVDLNYINNKPSSKLLLSDTLVKLESRKYILRVWITDSYIAENSSKTFTFDIGVRAV